MVSWTVRARRLLRSSLAEALCRERHTPAPADGPRRGTLEQTMEQLNRILAATFPRAGSLIVQDQLLGHRRKENLYILLVEVLGPDHPGAYVVKIGPTALMEKELAGWNSCKPEGLHNDLVFLPLHEGTRCPPDAPGEPSLMSLVYGDAQQLIGVEQTSTLEAAALDAIRFGSPSVPSLGFVLLELYERIGHLLYGQSFVADPAREGFVFDLHPLPRSMELWETEREAQAVRCEANTLATPGSGHFLDPVDYLRYVQEHVPFRIDRDTVRPPVVGDADDAARPKPADVLPRMLRGCAHGDLHGRNILVGIVRGRVLWPTVFDYEDMSPCNYLGWDFVKLETELKIRAAALLFPGGQDAPFVRSVQQFEIDLHEETEKCHLARSWPAVADSKEPVERLRTILLELRHLASVHLGTHRGRPNEWLDEYRFLLACYGVTTVRFRNLQPRERLAAFLSAGAATARLAWTRSFPELAPPEKTATESRALQILKRRYPGYSWPLEMARCWSRSGVPVDRADAVELLTGLRLRYPHALAIGQELVLTLMECDRHPAAQKVLEELGRQFKNLDEETCCRWGRFFKDYADRYVAGPQAAADPNTAAAYYAQALHLYDRAFALRAGHYPGVNKATLLFLLGTVDPAKAGEVQASAYRQQAQELVRMLLGRRAEWPRDQDEDIALWHPATEAEGRLLLQEWDRSAALYRQVQAVHGFPPRARESMRRQVERILQGFRNLGIAAGGAFQDLETLFS